MTYRPKGARWLHGACIVYHETILEKAMDSTAQEMLVLQKEHEELAIHWLQRSLGIPMESTQDMYIGWSQDHYEMAIIWKQLAEEKQNAEE